MLITLDPIHRSKIPILAYTAGRLSRNCCLSHVQIGERTRLSPDNVLTHHILIVGSKMLATSSGNSSEVNTLLVTDWIAHTPPDVLAKNFGVSVQEHSSAQPMDLPKRSASSATDAVEAQMAAVAGKPPNPFVFRLGDMAPNRDTKSGTVRIADSTNFLVSKTVAASMVTIKPGGMREMHWHPNADEWLYILKGTGRATVFNTGPAAITTNFHAGDIGYIKKAFGHYLENTGNSDLVYMEVFRADRFEEVSVSDWLGTAQSTWWPRL